MHFLMLIYRTITAAAVILSALVHGRLLPFEWFVFHRPWVLKIFPEIWRLATSFLITGQGLSILFDPYFLYTYGSSLETESTRFQQPEDFVTYVVFVCTVILVSLLSDFRALRAPLLPLCVLSTEHLIKSARVVSS